MAIWNLYSKRQKILRGDVPDVYAYEAIPDSLRIQVVHMLRDVLGDTRDYRRTYQEENIREAYRFIKDTLCREYGVFTLGDGRRYGDIDEEVFDFIINTPDPDFEKVLDAIELSFAVVDSMTRDYGYRSLDYASEKADAAIDELNQRFKEHGVGYEFKDGKIMRIDSEYIHKEAVKPALQALSDKQYKNANKEFLEAHEHYRHGRYKDCLAWALKSLESTMKIICKKMNWPYKQTDTASTLINTCFDNGLIPPYWQSHFGSLRAMLQSGVPTARNVTSSHGQGDKQVEVPGYLAAYCLHMTASTLVFLVEAEKALS